MLARHPTSPHTHRRIRDHHPAARCNKEETSAPACHPVGPALCRDPFNAGCCLLCTPKTQPPCCLLCYRECASTCMSPTWYTRQLHCAACCCLDTPQAHSSTHKPTHKPRTTTLLPAVSKRSQAHLCRLLLPWHPTNPPVKTPCCLLCPTTCMSPTRYTTRLHCADCCILGTSQAHSLTHQPRTPLFCMLHQRTVKGTCTSLTPPKDPIINQETACCLLSQRKSCAPACHPHGTLHAACASCPPQPMSQLLLCLLLP
jgi:hypothetical protein